MAERLSHAPSDEPRLKRLSDLEARLQTCLLFDQRRLSRQVRALRERLHSPDSHSTDATVDNAFKRLTRELKRSVSICKQRADQTYDLQFPGALPFTKHVRDISTLIENHQVLILSGATGTGKSTQLPKLCLQLGRGIAGRIGHTQPRRIAARSIAARIAHETATKPGQLVGHCVRFDDNLAPRTRIKLMTDGILLNEILHDPWLEQYDTVILDEVHERSLNVDFLIGHLKGVLARRADLRLILTSATVDARAWLGFFDDVVAYDMPDRAYPIDLRYRPIEAAKDDRADINEAIVAAVSELDGENRADILVFLPGEREIRDAARRLSQAELEDTEIVPLYARLSASRQARIFQPQAPRRIILATNLAETSLTVPRVRHVIDSGLARVSRYDPRRKLQQLPVEPIARANANQRMGRCGREGPGTCIRLYDESDYEARREAIEPEIQRTSLGRVILQLKAMGIADVEHFPFAEAPDVRLIKDGYTLLQEIGALDSARQLTPVGQRLARLPIDPRLGRVLLCAADLNCLAEGLIIVSGLSIVDPRESPHELREVADRAHAEFADKRSDFLWFVKAWPFARALQRLPLKRRARRCRRRFLSYVRMREWVEVHDQLSRLTRDLDLQVNASPASYKVIHTALAAGFLSHIGRWQELLFHGCRNQDFVLHPSSTLRRRPPKWIVAAEIVETERRYARIAGRLDAHWLECVATHLIKRTYDAPCWDAKRGCVRATEIQRLYGLLINQTKQIDYVRIDRDAARQIFIDTGLLDGELGEMPDFLIHNRALIARIHDLEARVRRRDLLGGRAMLRSFYDKRLPGEVVSRRVLLRWLRKSPEHGQSLIMEESDATNENLASVSTYLFPDTLDIAGTHCVLTYRFEPGDRQDGITLSLPLVLLPRLKHAHMDRLVPGMLSEKVEGLLRALPKTQRRLVSPIREYAMACLEAIEAIPGPLNVAMSAAVEKILSVRISADAFDEAQLAPHLRCVIEVVNDTGEVVASGRDLDRLKQDHLSVAESRSQALEWGVAERSAKDWSFGEIPERVQVAVGSTSVEGYPALVDAVANVRLTVFESLDAAARAHLDGVVRLLTFGATRERKALQRDLPGRRDLSLLAIKFGYTEDPIELLVRTAARRWCKATGPPRDKAGFDALKTAFNHVVVTETTRSAAALLPLFERGVGVLGRLEAAQVSLPMAAVADIRSQIGGLLGAQVAERVDRDATDRYRRYFDAIERRLERMDAHPGKDLGKLEKIAPMWQRYLEITAIGPDLSETARDLYQSLEEYRVALFAPELGVIGKVSDTQLWAGLDALAGRD